MPIMASDLDANPKKSRTRSPAYPYLDLRSALEKAATLWQAEGRHAAAVNVVMHHWGYKEDSSTGHSCMAALKKFGLIEHDGMGENKQIRLSALALAILHDDNPDSPERAEALRTAALGPRIHAELWERYGSDLPSDQSLKRYLVLEKSFNEAVVDELVAEYKASISFAGLDLLPAPAKPPATFAAAAPPVLPPSAVQARYSPPVPAAEELPYDWREASSAPLQPPPRAIGPRRELPDPYYPATRENVPAAERPYAPAPRAAAPPPGSENRRREAAPVYAPSARQAAEREAARYDQEGFGYEDEYPAPVAALPSRPVAQPSLPPAPVAGIEVETLTEIPRKELPVPLDGDRVALVPYPMTEEDFTLLIATLQLWKKRLVR